MPKHGYTNRSLTSKSNNNPEIPEKSVPKKYSWRGEISPDGAVTVTILASSKFAQPTPVSVKTFDSEKIKEIISANCKKNNRFLEINFESFINHYVEANLRDSPQKVLEYCALISALRSSYSYDSPYGGGKKSIFNIPAFLGCTISSKIHAEKA